MKTIVEAIRGHKEPEVSSKSLKRCPNAVMKAKMNPYNMLKIICMHEKFDAVKESLEFFLFFFLLQKHSTLLSQKLLMF